GRRAPASPARSRVLPGPGARASPPCPPGSSGTRATPRRPMGELSSLGRLHELQSLEVVPVEAPIAGQETVRLVKSVSTDEQIGYWPSHASAGFMPDLHSPRLDRRLLLNRVIVDPEASHPAGGVDVGRKTPSELREHDVADDEPSGRRAGFERPGREPRPFGIFRAE